MKRFEITGLYQYRFDEFEIAVESYDKTLVDDEELEESSKYYDEVCNVYLNHCDKLNETLDELVAKKSKNTDSISAWSHVMNMYKLEFASFDGNSSQYHKFMSIFKQTIEPGTSNPRLRLIRLLCHTIGEVHAYICGVELGDSK